MLRAIVITFLVLGVGIPLVSLLGGILVAPILAIIAWIWEWMKEHPILAIIIVVILLFIAL